MSGKGIEIPVSADFNSQDTEREVQRLTAQVNKLGQAMATLNKMKFSPVDKGTIDDMRRMEAQFGSLLKINGGLRGRLSATGQGGKGLTEIDWSRVYSDSTQRGRSLRSIYDYSTAGTQFADRFLAPAQPGGGGGGRRPPGGDMPDFPAQDPSFPGHRMIDAGLSATGPVGRVASGALSAGLRGGLMAGAGAMIGGLGVLGVAKGVGAVMDKVGSAEGESIGYDTLKRTIGDVNVSFEVLRSSSRQAAYALGASFEEAQKLAGEFAKLSNTTSDGQRRIANEVGIGGGLSRSFGLSLGSGVGTMGTMRQFGVTSDSDGSRRLALMIGEAVGRVGFAKADEVLAAVTQFTSMQARASLAAPNVSGYLGALSGLAGSGRPGLDAQGSAALLGRVNSTIMGGGGGGEAGQNFMLANVGRPLGLSPIQTRILLQQGAFGSGSSAFGKGSIYSDFASKYGGGVSGGAGGSSATNLDMILGGLRRNYGGMGADYLASSTAQLLGINETQAMAMHLHGGQAMGGIAARLKGKVPMSSLSSTAFGALAAIQTGGADVLSGQADSLRGRTGMGALSSSELQRLNEAMGGGNVEVQRQVLTELTATREQEASEGTQVRESITGVENKIQEFASKLIPISVTARDALIALATKLAPDSEFGRAAAEGKRITGAAQTIDGLNSKLSGFDAETDSLRQSQQYQSMSPEDRVRWENGRKLMRRPLEASLQRGMGQYGSTDALVNAVMMTESGGRRFDANGNPLSNPHSSALGEMQVLDGTAADPGFGIRPAKPGDIADRARVGRELLQTYMGIFNGDVAKSAAAYKQGFGGVKSAITQGGDRWLEGTDPETQAYVAKVLGKMGGAGSGRGGQGGPTAEEIHATLVLHPKTPDGKSAGKPVVVELGRPKASGLRAAE